MKHKKKKHRITDDAICDAIYEAIRQDGWSIPTDEASVATAEARMENYMPTLPERLRHPEFPSASKKMPWPGKVVPLWDSFVLSAPMARAAREGGSVSPEIEKIMKRDREIAEQKLRHRNNDRGDDGENDDG
jgi:hypothetical protein